MRKVNRIGVRYGRLLVIKEATQPQNIKHKRVFWLCKCDCGNETVVASHNLQSGTTKSCGCWHDESARIIHTKHSKINTRLYGIWLCMKNRCYHKSHKEYNHYGGKGITICDEWLNDFETFYNWANENGYNDNLTIDRIDNNKGYSPDNCRWATRTEQTRNRTNTIFLTYNGTTLPMAEWCEKTGLSYSAVRLRLERGWDVEKTLTTPKR